MQPDRDAHASRYWVFRGEAHGTPVAWGTTATLGRHGALTPDPVMLSPPSGIVLGPAMIPGDAPPLPSTTITLADPEGEIAQLLLPDVRGQQELTGAIYVGDISTEFETRVTPTLRISGNSELSDGRIDIHLEADADAVLGRPVALWPLRELIGFEFSNMVIWPGDEGYVLRGRAPSELWRDFVYAVTRGEDAIVPWEYGGLVELTPTTGEYPRYWVACLRSEPRVPSAAELYCVRDGKPEETGPLPREHRPIPLMVELEGEDLAGVSRQVNLLIYYMPEPPPDDEEPERYVFGPRYVAITRQPFPSEQELQDFATPASVVAKLVVEQSAAGSDGIHWPSFRRVIEDTDPTFGGTAGGVLGGANVTLAELMQQLAPTCGLRLWIGPDDKLHAAIPTYTRTDQQDARGDLLELQEGDVFPADASGTPYLRSSIISDPDDDAAGVTRVSVDWDEDQRMFYPLQTSSTLPSLGAPVARGRERVLSGAWLRGDSGVRTAVALQTASSGDALRVEIASHLSLVTSDPASLLRLTHPRGPGVPGLGWERRLCRLDAMEARPEDDATVLTLTDLGPSEAMRLGLLDAISEWVMYLPGSGDVLRCYFFHEPSAPEYNKTLMEFGLPGTPPGAAEEYIDATIWVRGSEHPILNRAWRIVHMVDGGPGIGWFGSAYPDEEIDPDSYGWSVFEDIEVVLDGPLVSAWQVMRTHMQSGASYRPDYIRGADIERKLFDDDEPAFQFSSF